MRIFINNIRIDSMYCQVMYVNVQSYQADTVSFSLVVTLSIALPFLLILVSSL